MKMKSLCTALVTALVFSITGCGGGGGGGTTPTPPTTSTGKFVDAPVEGLKYVSGGQSGFTNPNGVFTYEVGQPVTFSIGGVTIGQTQGAATITPIDLINAANPGINATPATPAVVRIVQFLLTASSVTDTGIKIDSAVTTACASQSINLSTTTNATTFNTMINQVATAAGNRTITTAVDAQNHFTASLNGLSSNTLILPNPSITGGGALPPSISSQPSNSSIFSSIFGGGGTTFTVNAIGYNLSYQWQVDTGSGFTNISDTGVYTGSATATLTLTGVTRNMDGYKYRVIVSGLINPPTTSSTATLTVTTPTKVIVKLATSGTLPTGINIGGIDTTVTYPTNKGLSITANDVVASGVAAGSLAVPNINIAGEARIANITGTGFPIGEFATLTFSIASGSSPLATDFAVAPGATILDSTLNANKLNGVSVVVQSVTFQ